MIPLISFCILIYAVIFFGNHQIGPLDTKENDQSNPSFKKGDSSTLQDHRQISKADRDARMMMDREKIAKGPAVFGETGMLTTGMAETLGLSKDEAQKINGLIFKTNKSFEIALAKNSKYNENESIPENNISVYDIPALEDRGETLLSELKNNLVSELGVTLGTKLYDLLRNSPNADKMFGGYGKYDIKLKFQPPDPSKRSEIAAYFTYSDPVSGKWLSKNEMTLEKFQEMFGSTFEFDPASDK